MDVPRIVKWCVYARDKNKKKSRLLFWERFRLRAYPGPGSFECNVRYASIGPCMSMNLIVVLPSTILIRVGINSTIILLVMWSDSQKLIHP